MKHWLGILILTFSLSVYGQDTLALYRSELLSKVEENLNIKSAWKDAEMARADFNQSKALYLPSVSASYTFFHTTNPLMAFGSKLNQEILTPQDFDPTILNDPEAISNYATEIQVLQPLLNLDGIQERQAAKIQSEAMALKAQRIKEYFEFEVVKAYMQLQLGYEALDVLKKAKATSAAGLSMIQDYYEEGLVHKSDVLAIQVRDTEVANQLSYAISNVRNGSDYLATLLGEESYNKVYYPQDRVIDTLLSSSIQATLPESRKDLLAMEMATEGYHRVLNANQSKFLPRINAFGSYQLYDNNLFGFGANGYFVGVNLSWQLFDGNRNIGKTQKAKAQFEKSQLESSQYKLQSQLELNKSNRQLNDAAQKVSLNLMAFNQSKEAYRIIKDRFEEGLEKTTEYLMAEAKMFQKELEYQQAIYEFNLTGEYLNFLTN